MIDTVTPKDRSEAISLFVLRRAWLFGLCTRTDINRAMDLGKGETNTRVARNAMLLAVSGYPGYLKHINRTGVFPATERQAPPNVSAETILDLLARNAPPIVTGVFPEELMTMVQAPLPSRASRPNVTQLILRSGVKGEPLRILYAGLRSGETARWRRILIRAFEHTGLYWRVKAQDMDAPGYPIKSYVLGRILDAEQLDSRDVFKEKPDFVKRSIIKKTSMLKVFFADALTPDQKQGIANQFGIEADGTLKWPEYAVHDFCRENGPKQDSSTIVWPLFSRIDVLPE